MLPGSMDPVGQFCRISMGLGRLGPNSICCYFISAWGIGILEVEVTFHTQIYLSMKQLDCGQCRLEVVCFKSYLFVKLYHYKSWNVACVSEDIQRHSFQRMTAFVVAENILISKGCLEKYSMMSRYFLPSQSIKSVPIFCQG